MTALRPLVPRLATSNAVMSRQNRRILGRSSDMIIGTSIDAGTLDPFQSYPISQVSCLDDLMKHCELDGQRM
jgi:hypothetical protein